MPFIIDLGIEGNTHSVIRNHNTKQSGRPVTPVRCALFQARHIHPIGELLAAGGQARPLSWSLGLFQNLNVIHLQDIGASGPLTSIYTS